MNESDDVRHSQYKAINTGILMHVKQRNVREFYKELRQGKQGDLTEFLEKPGNSQTKPQMRYTFYNMYIQEFI